MGVIYGFKMVNVKHGNRKVGAPAGDTVIFVFQQFHEVAAVVYTRQIITDGHFLDDGKGLFQFCTADPQVPAQRTDVSPDDGEGDQNHGQNQKLKIFNI